jgi:3'-5' exonuclease
MTNEHLKRILFIDIETASVTQRWEELNENMQQLWVKKAKTIRGVSEEDALPSRIFEEKAGIFSEFSKVVCISIGSLVLHENEWVFRLKSIVDQDEKILLNNFLTILSRFEASHKEMKFCGHNIKEFDLPFLCRRMVINGIALPGPLQLNNKKPWEVPHLDTLELWKFGDYKNYTSLALLAEVLGLPSPKSDIDGSMVGKVYWVDRDLDRIAQYCMQDVLTTAKVYLHLTGQNNIEIVPAYL